MAEQARADEGNDTSNTGGKPRRGGAGGGLGTDRAREVGLFRYALIRQAADPALSPGERGRLVRELAATEHAGPFGDEVRVSRETLDRWIRAWRAGGFDALLPVARTGKPRTGRRVLEMGVALKREAPARTAAQCHAILVELLPGPAPSLRTLQRHFAALELNTRPDGKAPKAFGRFQAAARNDRWTGDALHGPVIGGRKVYLLVTWNQRSGWIVTDRHHDHELKGPVAHEHRGEVARPGSARASCRVAQHLDQSGPCSAHHRRLRPWTRGVPARL